MEETTKKSSGFVKLIKVLVFFAAVFAAVNYIISCISKKWKKREEGNGSREICEYYACTSGREIIPDDAPFKGLLVKTLCSGVVIDLRNCTFEGDSFITLNAKLSGVDIKVPEGVNVKLDGLSKLSGFANKTDEITDENVPTLYIAANALCSGVAVRRCSK